MRIRFTVLLLCCALVVCSGCTARPKPDVLLPTDIVGTWTRTSDDHFTLMFDANGTGTVTASGSERGIAATRIDSTGRFDYEVVDGVIRVTLRDYGDFYGLQEDLPQVIRVVRPTLNPPHTQLELRFPDSANPGLSGVWTLSR